MFTLTVNENPLLVNSFFSPSGLFLVWNHRANSIFNQEAKKGLNVDENIEINTVHQGINEPHDQQPLSWINIIDQ